MKITWLGHACFCAESDGYRIVLDPYTMESYPPLHVAAHQALCSHGHRDHNFTEAVEYLPARENPFTITTVAAFHDDAQGTKRGENTIHMLEAEGLRVVHLGDLGHELSSQQIAPLSGCDVLLIPIGGFYTIDAPTAKRVADAVKPRIVVPMHYRHGEYGLRPVGELGDFLKLWNRGDITYLSEASFEVSSAAPRGVVVPKFVP